MIKSIFFDLGQTLIQYYTREQFKTMLPEIFEGLYSRLETRLDKPKGRYREALLAEGRENADYSIRPLSARLGKAFGLSESEVERLGLSEVFMEPIMKTSSLYEDTKPMLETLGGTYALALVSNTPWGCPKRYFEQELARYGIRDYFDAIVFCTDVGFRKPHRMIFEYALDLMKVRPEETLMVGDRLDWDIAGARSTGLAAVLIDRDGPRRDEPGAIRSLRELPAAIARIR